MASRAVLGAPGGDCTRLSGVRGDPAAPREDPTRDAAAGGSGKPGPGVGSRQLALGFPSCVSSLSILPRGRRGRVVRSRRGSVTCSAPCCGSGPLRPHCPFRRAGAVTPSSGCCRGSGRAPLGRPGRGTELGSLCPLHALHRRRCVALAAADREGPPRVGDSHLSGLSHFLVTVSLPDSPRPPCRFSRPAAHCPRAARVWLALAGAAAGAFLTRPPNLELGAHCPPAGPSPAPLGG